MKPQNTIENKAKFFALYWGQEVLYFESPEGINPFTINSNNMWGSGDFDQKKDAWLELTHLSMITDEDAIEVANIIGDDY